MELQSKWAVHMDNEKASIELTKEIVNRVREHRKFHGDISLVCIGTSRSTGDSLGPLVGTFIEESNQLEDNCTLYGTLNANVHAQNIDGLTARLKNEGKFIIALDSCLSVKSERVGNIYVEEETIKPGLALGKRLEEIGDIAITGIVNISGGFDFLVLQNTDLGKVYRMARIIADAIVEAMRQLKNN